MKIETEGNRIRVSNIPELNAVNAPDFRDKVRSAMPQYLESIEVDMAQTRFVDSSGLGALFALYKATREGRTKATLRILNPSPSILQLLELTQIHLLFEIDHTVAVQKIA
jgi:anti-sigma B factor antagonist